MRLTRRGRSRQAEPKLFPDLRQLRGDVLPCRRCQNPQGDLPGRLVLQGELAHGIDAVLHGYHCPSQDDALQDILHFRFLYPQFRNRRSWRRSGKSLGSACRQSRKAQYARHSCTAFPSSPGLPAQERPQCLRVSWRSINSCTRTGRLRSWRPPGTRSPRPRWAAGRDPLP
mgnify:CR=1 FL=1